eukprot:9909216-Heterocapsa_arctica.AAC.1
MPLDTVAPTYASEVRHPLLRLVENAEDGVREDHLLTRGLHVAHVRSLAEPLALDRARLVHDFYRGQQPRESVLLDCLLVLDELLKHCPLLLHGVGRCDRRLWSDTSGLGSCRRRSVCRPAAPNGPHQAP